MNGNGAHVELEKNADDDAKCVKEKTFVEQQPVTPSRQQAQLNVARSNTIEIRGGGAGVGAGAGIAATRGGGGGREGVGGAGAAAGRAGGRQPARDEGGFKIEFEMPPLDGADLHASAPHAAPQGKGGRNFKRR